MFSGISRNRYPSEESAACKVAGTAWNGNNGGSYGGGRIRGRILGDNGKDGILEEGIYDTGSGLHLFLNLAFSKNISLCVGTAELLIAALFLTGLGEGLWQFFPCSWGGRWSGYLLLRWKGRAVMDAGMMRYGVCTGVAVTAGMWAVILLWFYFYEGRQRHD